MQERARRIQAEEILKKNEEVMEETGKEIRRMEGELKVVREK
jgi:hypothetical protein